MKCNIASPVPGDQSITAPSPERGRDSKPETHLYEQRRLFSDVVDELQLGQRLQGGGQEGGFYFGSKQSVVFTAPTLHRLLIGY